DTATATPTNTPTDTATATPTNTPTDTATATPTSQPTATAPAPVTRRVYMPLIVDSATLIGVVNGAAITAQPATGRGMIFWTATITLPAALPATGRYVLSSRPDGVSPALVDDGIVLSAGVTELFRYDYGAGGQPQPQVVEIPLAALAPRAGQAITAQLQDLHGSLIAASAVYLIWVP
ncbi:MAG TPA: hypothetical protein VD886_14960, partial [Herpetosiphonaceae bacterium]|nr:hypothetical protein [Herpetosiphonaceae bacterium]